MRFHATIGLAALLLGLVLAPPAPAQSSSATVAQSPDTVEVVEYYHSGLDHYFITADPGEIASLDANLASGWQRTQASFKAFAPSGTTTGVFPVCRFYGLPQAGLDSHFYTAWPSECSETEQKFSSAWVKESSNVFRTGLPDVSSGACGDSMRPVYRLFNERTDANHRYTADIYVRAQMILAGYVSEGFGPLGVVFCAPTGAPTQAASIVATRVTADTYGFSGGVDASGVLAMAYNWDFGDGTRAAGPTALHKYNATGSYTVTLQLTDQHNRLWSASARVEPVVAGTPATTPAVAPACTVSANPPYPVINSTTTLLAVCTGAPRTYRWVGCNSSTNACVAQSGAAGDITYSVVADNAVGSSAPASHTVTWLPPGATPPTTPPRPSCLLSTSAASAVVGALITLTAACTASPTTYAWTNCSSTTSTCSTSATAAGTQTYTVRATNAGGTSAPVSVQVIWTATGSPPPPPPPPTPPPPPPPPPTVPPVVGPPGAWTQYATSVLAGTEAPRQSWYNLAWDSKRHRAYGISWFKTLSAFDPALGRWWDVAKSPNIGDFHNRTIAYDPINDRLWVSNGTGKEPGGFQYFDLAAGGWTFHCIPTCGEPSYQAPMFYDAARARLITFGGWVDTRVRTFSLQPIGSGWQTAPISGGPSYPTEFEKMTVSRSLHDTARDRIIYVQGDGTLWVLPMSLSGWQTVATNGTPPPLGTQFVYDAANDAIVGWSASHRISAGEPMGVTTRETWTLSFTSLTWTRAASHPSVSVPQSTPYVGYAMVYDPVRSQTILHTMIGDSEYDVVTWAYRHPGAGAGPPPPPPPPPPGASPPSCTLSASAASAVVGTLVTLTANCTGAPSSYAWTNCNSATSTCSAQSASPGAQTYSVIAANAAGMSPAASVQVTWQPNTPTPPPPPTVGTHGTIESFALPAIANAPYSTLLSSKHTNMASNGARIYVSGGDWTHSATDGTWSMDLANGSWRQDVGVPIYPTRPAPHALQDGAGFVWVAARSKFLLWPGSYTAYDPPGAQILEYAKGTWWFDPATNTYEQDLRLFGTPGSGTGNLFGGVYDEVNQHIVAFGDSSSANVARRWDVVAGTQIAHVNFNVTNPPGHAAYFARGMHVKVGRHVYIIGYRTNGDVSSQTPLFLRWHLDNRTMEELAPPPVDGTKIVDIEIRIGTSNGKIVWPFVRGPEGDINGIYVYDPAANQWAVDIQVPSYGNFIGNAVTSLPDGRVAWSGGVFGRQQTHIWFYRAN